MAQPGRSVRKAQGVSQADTVQPDPKAIPVQKGIAGMSALKVFKVCKVLRELKV